MRLALNMAAGVSNAIVLVLINLLAVPFYLRLLGMEAYGLIGFYVTLQTVLQVLDVGLAPTVSREIARDLEAGAQRRSASLLRTLGIIYAAVALAIAIVVALVAPWIGGQWLQAETLSATTVTQAVALMGVNLACRWPISLYHNALVGSHRLARSAIVSIAFNICAAVASIVVLTYVARSIQAFFVVQAGFGLLHAVALRVLAHQAVGERDAPYDFRGLRRVWKFSVWVGSLSIIGLTLSQIDKLVLSRALPLETFGHYMLAALIVGGLQVVIMPIFNALYPKFATLFARGDLGSLAFIYGKATRIYSSVLFALAFAIACHTDSMVTIWLGSRALALDVAPLAALLAIGSALHGVMYLPYALQLATGKPKIAFISGLLMLGFMIPATLMLANKWGAVGGALAWAMFGGLYALIGTSLSGWKVMPFAGWEWFRRDVAVPLVAALLPALLGLLMSRMLQAGPWAALAIGGLAAFVGAVLGSAGTFSVRELRGFFNMAPGPNFRFP